MKKHYLLPALLLSLIFATAQNIKPTVKLRHTQHGNNGQNYFYAAVPTADGRFLMAGNADSSNTTGVPIFITLNNTLLSKKYFAGILQSSTTNAN
jgi:hypothetical protein